MVLKKFDNFLIYIFDKIVATIILVLLSPLLGFIYVFLFIYYKGSPIFKQKRAGLYGRPFELYKFKTMLDLYDNGKLTEDFKRLTKVGIFLRKFSIDEIPQLINVVKGDMSLVGPRPLYLEYVPIYDKEQAKRLNVLPGITGWAQINGRNSISWEEKFALDIWYVEHKSIFINILILSKTVLHLFKRHGINHSGHNTMPIFRGTNKN